MSTVQNAYDTKRWLLWFQPSTQMMPSIWKEMCRRVNLYKEVCKGLRNKKTHGSAQNTDPYQKEDDIDIMKINATTFNSEHSVITADLKLYQTRLE